MRLPVRRVAKAREAQGRDMPDTSSQQGGVALQRGSSALGPLFGGLLGGALVLAGVALFDAFGGAHRDADRSQVSSDLGATESASELAVQVANLELAQGRLQDELASLRRQLAGARVEPEEAAAEQVSTLSEQRQPPPRAQGRASVASAAALVAAGVSETDADQIISRLDALALARLEANYRVRQASGDEAQQARLERRAIPKDSAVIREEFGEAAYDRYLYSLEQPNRVAVASVLRESTAQGAGVQNGDLLRSLGGEPLYSVRDLTERVRQGSPDETYALVVERNGETIETWVPGGPLGVRVTGEVVEPGN